ncbi:rhoptry kinase family protein ROP32 [Besnoitia besnoiti]|uniref:Rhoptry kinase family protein ROP32 n=1 Tax=Besnoitia besnoiti TaxID=94643 RepID=A0A2A9ML11_BESBE|nr:rhoptry kinase family protein ROP32 [Besnoitia besnoiti]PFH36696.1 rhoptry kinase family protein ROP32 [Besnoitia besnoiti]
MARWTSCSFFSLIVCLLCLPMSESPLSSTAILRVRANSFVIPPPSLPEDYHQTKAQKSPAAHRTRRRREGSAQNSPAAADTAAPSFISRIVRRFTARSHEEGLIDVSAGRAEAARAASACFEQRRRSTFHPSHIASRIGELMKLGQLLRIRLLPQQGNQAEMPPEPLIVRRGPFLGCGASGAVFAVYPVDQATPYAMKVFLASIREGGSEAYIHAHLASLLRKNLEVFKVFQGKSESLLRHEKLAAPLFGGEILDFLPLSAVNKQKYVSNLVIFSPLMACDISQLIDHSRTGSLSVQARVHITQSMVNAVASLHKYGFVHRDIKLNNFLVDRYGDVFLSDLDFITEVGEAVRPAGPALYTDPDSAATLWEVERKNENPDELPDDNGTREKPPLVATKTMDAWALGLTIFRFWCNDLPWDLGLLKNATTSEKLQRIATAKRQQEPLKFNKCSSREDMPRSVKDLIRQFLRFEQIFRLLPESEHCFRLTQGESHCATSQRI